MTRTLILLAMWLAAAFTSQAMRAAEPSSATAARDDAANDAIRIDDRRELFVDRHLIDRLDGAQLKLHAPQKAEVALQWDKPWEGAFCGYVTVLHDGPLYRMYYRGLPVAQHAERTEVTCYAESDDGIHWRRPNLGLFEVHGTRDNNVVLAGDRGAHNFCPFIDTRPDCPKDQRYKAVGGSGKPGLQVYVSADGIHWRRLRDDPILTRGAFDSQNIVFYSDHERCYLCYFRTFDQGVRTVSRATSEDFVNWSDPVEMNYGDTPREQLYTSQTHPYFRAPHLYVAFPMRVVFGRRVLDDATAERQQVVEAYRNDCADGVFMTTRGGNRYDRTFLEAFFRPGPDPGNWVSRVNMAALGVVPTGPAEMSIYYSQHYAQPSHHLVRCTLRTDGFASVNAGHGGGEVVTRPLVFRGSRLTMNYATSAAGRVQVELQDADGKPIVGFALDDCPPMTGDQIDGPVAFGAGADLAKLAGRPVRLRIVLADADVYSFRFHDPDAP